MWSMCWSCKNFANVSEEKNGPLSVVSLLRGSYREMSDLILLCDWFCCFR